MQLIRQRRTYRQVYYGREAQFSRILQVELPKLLPEFSLVPFSPYIQGDEGSRRRPDMALVARNYSTWIVVEVELESHSLAHHVIPQVRAFASGRYERSHAVMLHDKDPTLDLDSLVRLVEHYPPAVAVIVNSRSVLQDGWDQIETDYSARLMFLESFRSEDGDVIVAVSGYTPTVRTKRLMHLRPQRLINALICSDPSSVPADAADAIELTWEDQVFLWQIIRTKDAVLFFPPGRFDVRWDRNYEIIHTTSVGYQIRQM